MANVNLIDPYSQQAEEIARRQRMAQALQESGSQVLQMPTTPGVAISPYAGLAKILESGLGAYKEKQAREDYAKLQTDYRNKYNTQFENFARALSAPAQEAFAGQEAIEAKPAQMAPQIEKSFGGYGMPREVGQYEVSPAVAGQAAIPARPALPAGYISPEMLSKIDIPEVKQLLMAKYLKQFEPDRVTLGENQRVLERTGGGGFKELIGPATTAAKKLNPEWKEDSRQINGKTVAGWINLNAETPATTFVAGGKPEKGKEITPHWVSGQKIIDKKPVFGWYDLNAGDSTKYEESFKTGAIPPAGEKSNWKEVTRNNKIVYQDFNIADPKEREASSIDKESVPVKKIRMDVTNEDGSTQTVLMDETDPQFAKGFVTKGPEYVSITTVNSKGETEVRQVKRNDEILKTGYVKPLEGFLGQLQAAGVSMDKIRNDPKITDLVNRYFVKTAGGVAPEDVAGFDLKKAEVVARLGELGIDIPTSIKGLNLSVTPGALGGAQSSSSAAPAPAIAKTPPKINDVVVNGDKKYKFKGGDPNQQSSWVEVK